MCVRASLATFTGVRQFALMPRGGLSMCLLARHDDDHARQLRLSASSKYAVLVALSGGRGGTNGKLAFTCSMYR
ncbi:MAG: hypothetical protein LBJ95_04350 [Oscillospiraceae bacterium]|nr:hypothetical protein [Oscillospiraceae bacterium]